ncbi:hypothetical protein SAMN05216215_10335 [Saccharopolyspora shandongensis]|uniref:Uncharacterized protein n=1 Tax=Saccharopolyspora shandongensis TaxID=418495 RepID=A0A1H3M1W4_9PSEU|nr:hypothetical protein SAMN05216215_10335 [Saccharopolyspora shandongensis]
MSTEDNIFNNQGHEVGCTDVMGRNRGLRVLPLTHGRVGVQSPPGEWFEVNAEQLRDLLAAAREAIWESHANYDPTPRTIVVGGTCF